MEFKNSSAGPKSFRGFQSFKEYISLLALGFVLLVLSYLGLSEILSELPEQICYYSDPGTTCTTDFGIGSMWIVAFQALGLLGLGIFGLYILVVVVFQPKRKNVRKGSLSQPTYLEHVQDVEPNLGQLKNFPLKGNPLDQSRTSNIAMMKQGFWFFLIVSMVALQSSYEKTGVDWESMAKFLAPLFLISIVGIWFSLSRRVGRAEIDRISLIGNSIMMVFKISPPGQLSLQVGDDTFDEIAAKNLNEELAKRVSSSAAATAKI